MDTFKFSDYTENDKAAGKRLLRRVETIISFFQSNHDEMKFGKSFSVTRSQYQDFLSKRENVCFRWIKSLEPLKRRKQALHVAAEKKVEAWKVSNGLAGVVYSDFDEDNYEVSDDESYTTSNTASTSTTKREILSSSLQEERTTET